MRAIYPMRGRIPSVGIGSQASGVVSRIPIVGIGSSWKRKSPAQWPGSYRGVGLSGVGLGLWVCKRISQVASQVYKLADQFERGLVIAGLGAQRFECSA